jgi:hypothetical protein
MNLNKIYPRLIVTDMLNLVRGWQALPPMSTTMEQKKMEVQCHGKIQNVATSTTPRGNSKDA